MKGCVKDDTFTVNVSRTSASTAVGISGKIANKIHVKRSLDSRDMLIKVYQDTEHSTGTEFKAISNALLTHGRVPRTPN